MPVFDTYLKRKRRAERSPDPELILDALPQTFRVQVAYILKGTIGPYGVNTYGFDPPSNARWQTIRDIVARERGVFSLTKPNDTPLAQVMGTLLAASTDEALDIIETSFRFIDRCMDGHEQHHEGLAQNRADALDEINQRFREHGLGYRYEQGQVIRVDSELLHAEVTVPALRLLRDEGFTGPLDEFMQAHDHFRKREFKDANVDALNAVESTLKAICDAKKWKYPSTANGTGLIRIVVNHGLIPPHIQTQFEHLIKAFEVGLPVVRHNHGGHGQGATPIRVPEHLAEYALNLMAANIVLLIEAYREAK